MIEDAGEEDDLTKTFTTEHLAGVALTVAEGLTIHSQLFLKFGLVRVMVELAPLVVEGMDVADLPREDFVVLQMAGRPLAEMEEIVEHTKQNVSRLTEDLRDLKSALSEANEQISELGGQLSNATPKNPPKRRWFKGIAKIGSGILLAGVNGSGRNNRCPNAPNGIRGGRRAGLHHEWLGPLVYGLGRASRRVASPYPEEQIRDSDLTPLVEKAKQRREACVAKAAQALSPFGVDPQAVEEFVDGYVRKTWKV